MAQQDTIERMAMTTAHTAAVSKAVSLTAEEQPDPRRPRNPSRIVVGVDGSDLSIEALRQAAALADALDARLDAVCVWSRPFPTQGVATADWHPERNAARALRDVAAAVFGDQKPARLHTWIIEGSTVRTLISESGTADLLVVGSQGHGGLTSPLLGSVAAGLSVHARCPVMIVHPTGTHTDRRDAVMAGSTVG